MHSYLQKTPGHSKEGSHSDGVIENEAAIFGDKATAELQKHLSSQPSCIMSSIIKDLFWLCKYRFNFIFYMAGEKARLRNLKQESFH